MLNTVEAADGQIEKILSKYLSWPGVFSEKCSYDDEDDIYFVSIRPKLHPTVVMEFQVRRDGTYPCFFGLTKEQTRYDVGYISERSPALYTRLRDISSKVIKDWQKGNYL